MKFMKSVIVFGLCALIASCANTGTVTNVSSQQYGLAVSTVGANVSTTLGANLVDYSNAPVGLKNADGSETPLLVRDACGQNDAVSIVAVQDGTASVASNTNPGISGTVGRGLFVGASAKYHALSELVGSESAIVASATPANQTAVEASLPYNYGICPAHADPAIVNAKQPTGTLAAAPAAGTAASASPTPTTAP